MGYVPSNGYACQGGIGLVCLVMDFSDSIIKSGKLHILWRFSRSWNPRGTRFGTQVDQSDHSFWSHVGWSFPSRCFLFADTAKTPNISCASSIWYTQIESKTCYSYPKVVGLWMLIPLENETKRFWPNLTSTFLASAWCYQPTVWDALPEAGRLWGKMFSRRKLLVPQVLAARNVPMGEDLLGFCWWHSKGVDVSQRNATPLVPHCAMKFTGKSSLWRRFHS